MHKQQQADLEKVTDYYQEKDIQDGQKVQQAFAALKTQKMGTAASSATKHVVINKEDVQKLVHEFELSEENAEKYLKQHDGKLIDTINYLVNVDVLE